MRRVRIGARPGHRRPPEQARGTGPTVDGRDDRDAGRAVIEVVVLAVLVLLPVAYLLLAVLRIQAASFAVGQAARDAARLLDAAPTVQVGLDRAREVAALALSDQRVQPRDLQLRFVAPGGDCATGQQVSPTLAPGEVLDVCVIAVIDVPGIPSVLSGDRNTVTGVFTLHVGEFRAAPVT
ncbi:hypothetical protein [Nakamurella leprariae]|uniref:Pilus assembly protein n=1 Tax=Nakamurella leprariae TaxID=2803911 RepID=A0A938YFP4_9ACTN|nr:hypothetical protein [Nakamurella leprariae]MBM9467294.1 hypothetical protein [Nakamurella leprariae]